MRPTSREFSPPSATACAWGHRRRGLKTRSRALPRLVEKADADSPEQCRPNQQAAAWDHRACARGVRTDRCDASRTWMMPTALGTTAVQAPPASQATWLPSSILGSERGPSWGRPLANNTCWQRRAPSHLAACYRLAARGGRRAGSAMENARNRFALVDSFSKTVLYYRGRWRRS